jgi:hypothetical protein
MRAKSTGVVMLAAATLAWGTWAGAATPAERQAYRAALARAASDFQASHAPCRALKGNDRAVCNTEARAARVRAEEVAEAEYRNTPQARLDAAISSAKADYLVAKAKCGGQSGAERSACLRAARAVQGQAVSEAVTKKKAASRRQN